MNPEQPNRYQDELQDLVGAYALGALTPEEEQSLTEYLEICRSADAEVAQLQAAVQALPLSVPEMEPPPGLRDSIMAAIEAEKQEPPRTPELNVVPPPTRPGPTPIDQGRKSPTWLPWAAAAALLALTIGLLGWNFSLRSDEPASPKTVALQTTSPDVQGGGEVSYLADDGVIVVNLENVAELPEGEVYQGWVIIGDTPYSAGVVPSGENTLAFAGNPKDFDVFAITIEPGPIGGAAPTTAPILVAESAGLS